MTPFERPISVERVTLQVFKTKVIIYSRHKLPVADNGFKAK